MERKVYFCKHRERERDVLYYFTDYVMPIGTIITPISEYIEGFVEIDKRERTVRVKECTPGLENSPKRWILEGVITKAKTALKKNEYPDELNIES